MEMSFLVEMDFPMKTGFLTEIRKQAFLWKLAIFMETRFLMETGSLWKLAFLRKLTFLRKYNKKIEIYDFGI